MKVFISWSGDTSRQVAEALREWLPSVIQAITPYVSSEDIDKGARWSADISQELEDSNYGILCVTKSNLSAPWLNFEAGALSKSFDKSRVSPFLFGIDRTEVTGPLLQFQSTINEREDVYKLVRGINNSCESGLDESRLDQIFTVWWPSLETKLDSIFEVSAPNSDSPTGHKRTNEDVLEEILSLVRTQQKILSDQPEIRPMIESLIRRQSTGAPLPTALVRDLARTWHLLFGEMLTFIDSHADVKTTRKLLTLTEELDLMVNMITDRYDIGARSVVFNRHTRMNRERTRERQTEGE